MPGPIRNLSLVMSCLLMSAVDNRAEAEEVPGATQTSAWAEWRGPLRTGESPDADPPTEWSESKNIRWKARLPGLGHSSPVIWHDMVFLTTAEPFGPQLDPVPVTAPGAHDNLDVTQSHRYIVMCLDRSTGSPRWQRTVREALPHEGGHQTGSLASASPITDGKQVYASFGSQGIFALTMEGEPVWEHSVGLLHSKHAHGEGSSPSLHDGVLVVNCDHEGQSFVLALRASDGEILWTQMRNEVTSWASPLIAEFGGRAQVVTAGTDRIRAYDLHNGELIWQCGGLSANVVATPTASNGIVVLASSYDTRAMLAIQASGAAGDITGSDRILWQTDLRTPYVPSLLVTRGSVWFLRHYQGILSRRDLKTGEETGGPFRLNGIRDVFSSPVAAAGRIYVTDLDGRTLVIADEQSPRQLALNSLNDSFAATPALVDRQMLLRGRRFLYCIEDDSSAK